MPQPASRPAPPSCTSTPRDAASGAQRWHDDAVYTETVAAIRARGVPADVPWYPTYPGVRPELAVHDSMPHLAVLAQEPVRARARGDRRRLGEPQRVQPRDARVHESESVKRLPHSLFEEFTAVLPRERRAPVPRGLRAGAPAPSRRVPRPRLARRAARDQVLLLGTPRVRTAAGGAQRRDDGRADRHGAGGSRVHVGGAVLRTRHRRTCPSRTRARRPCARRTRRLPPVGLARPDE